MRADTTALVLHRRIDPVPDHLDWGMRLGHLVTRIRQVGRSPGRQGQSVTILSGRSRAPSSTFVATGADFARARNSGKKSIGAHTTTVA